jgi:plastocyanin
MKRLTLTLGPIVLAAVLAACSGASAAPATGSPGPAGTPSGATVAVVAKDLKFATPAVSAKAGSPFTIAFDNQDGAPHNIAISDGSGAKVFKGAIVAGQKVDYQVPALAAGTYTFICEVHPDMKGTLTVE